MRNPSTFQKSAIALAVSSILAGGATVARAEGAKSANGLEEIVVTATRREQSVLEIPFNISAVSGRALENANITDSVDALRTMAGVSMFDRGYRNAGMAPGIVIRGINVDSGANGDVPLAAPATVATYIDNTALFGNFILKDINRIEVLRGPQGTLYGSGSLAGNVRYIMNKPDTTDFAGEARVNFGKTDGSGGYNFNPDLLFNIPLGDTFAVRLNVGQVKNDGIIDMPNAYRLDANGDPAFTGDVATAAPEYRKLKDVDTVDIKYGRVSALFMPSESFSAQLTYQRQEDDIGGRRAVTHGDNLATGGTYGKYQFGGIQKEPSERTVELSSLEIEADLGFATLTSSTAYYDHTGRGISDNSGVYARNGWFYFYGSSPRPIAKAERFYDDSAWSQELRLVSKGDQFIDWTAGFFYTDQDYKLGQNSYLVGYIPYLNAINLYGFAPFTSNQDFLFRRDQKYQEAAVFGEATINFSDALHLTLGGRYFDNSVDVNALVDIPIWQGTAYEAPPGSAKKKISDDKFLFKANLAWDVTDRSMLYATYSQGYRHAGANAVPTTGKYGENPDYFTFNSDTVDNYELGFKGRLDRLNYSASVFYADWQNPQLNTATSNWGFFAAINGKSAKSAGIELELSGQLVDNLSYSVGYTYADSTLTADVYQPAGNFYATAGRPVFPDRVAADGDRLPGTAKNIFNVSFNHDLVLGNGMEITTVLSGYYQSDVLNSLGDGNCQIGYTSPAHVCKDSPSPYKSFAPVGTPNPNYAPTSIYSRYYAKLDGFQIWNLSSTLTKDAWSVSLYLKNMFNEAGVTGVSTFAASGSNTSPTQNYFGNNSRDNIALPRTFGVAVGYKF
jgi:outer membrane receptor protein involved in Fe transport